MNSNQQYTEVTGLKTGLEKTLDLMPVLSSGEELEVLASCDPSYARAALSWQLSLPAAKAILHQFRLSRSEAPALD